MFISFCQLQYAIEAIDNKDAIDGVNLVTQHSPVSVKKHLMGLLIYFAITYFQIT